VIGCEIAILGDAWRHGAIARGLDDTAGQQHRNDQRIAAGGLRDDNVSRAFGEIGAGGFPVHLTCDGCGALRGRCGLHRLFAGRGFHDECRRFFFATCGREKSDCGQASQNQGFHHCPPG
jgi:hypothetical protein